MRAEIRFLVTGQTRRDYLRKGEAIPAGAVPMMCRKCGLAVLITPAAVEILEAAVKDGSKTGALCLACAELA